MGYRPLVDFHSFALTKQFPITPSAIQPIGTPSTFCIDKTVQGFLDVIQFWLLDIAIFVVLQPNKPIFIANAERKILQPNKPILIANARRKICHIKELCYIDFKCFYDIKDACIQVEKGNAYVSSFFCNKTIYFYFMDC